MEQITRGLKVVVTTAFGDELEKRAVTEVETGDRFPVVRVCSEDEWIAASTEQRAPRSTAWPAQDVRPVKHASA